MVTRTDERSIAAGATRGAIPIGLGLLCFLAILLDGFDTAGVGVVVPVMAKAWSLPPAAFTVTFVATNLGAAVGYIACGPIADRIGRRPVILVSVLWFGVFTLSSAFATSVPTLAILRFVTALGLGGTVPTGFALAADHAAAKYREAMTIGVGTGLTAGVTLGGLIGPPLILNFGWPSVFVVGGLLPLVLTPVLWFLLPETPGLRREAALPAAAAVPRQGTFTRLFAGGLGARTVLLWLYSFLIFCANYALASWVPTLLTSFGFAPAQAPIGLFAMGLGGVLGNLLFIPIVGRFGARRVLVVSALLAMAGVLAIGLVDLPQRAVLLALGAVGAGLITSSVGQSALAVSLYPTEIRTTGVGWAAAMGRVGSIVGPAVGGALLALQWPARDIVQTACLPVLVAIAMLAALSWHSRGRTPARD
jgi:AAHS family 4-hydroxybenzoate transporter-like MFS transporter